MSTQLLLASSSPRRKSILNLAQIDFVTYSPQLDEAGLTSKLLKIYQGACQTALGRIVTGELAFHKAITAARMTQAPLILASDTLVMCRGYILGKPHNAETAKTMFNILLGKSLSSGELSLMEKFHVSDEAEGTNNLGQYHQVSTSACLLVKKELLLQASLTAEQLQEFKSLPEIYQEAKDYVRLLLVEQAGVYMQANSALFDDIIANYIASGSCYDKAGGYAVQEQTACLISKIDGDVYTIMGLPLHAILQKCGQLLPFRQTKVAVSEHKQAKIGEIKPLNTDATNQENSKEDTSNVTDSNKVNNLNSSQYNQVNSKRTRTNQSNVSRFNSALLQNLTSYSKQTNSVLHTKEKNESKFSQAASVNEPDLSLSKPINTNENDKNLVNSLQSKLRSINTASSLANKSMPSFLQFNEKK